MSDAIKVSITDPVIRRIVQACYPTYKGRKISVVSATKYYMNDYWSDGSRDYVIAYHLETGETLPPKQITHNPYHSPAHATVPIPEGVAMVEHTIFMGKDMGIRIHVNPANMARLLVAKVKD